MPVITTGPATLYITTSNTTQCIGNDPVWANWNEQWTTVGSTTSTVYLTDAQWTVWNTAYTETAEQAAAREAREEQARREVRQQFEVARARAEELLVSLLSDEQAVSRRDHGWFAVRGGTSGRVYRIHSNAIAGNVDRLGEDGRRDMIYCAHPPGLPAADVHLAQMLQLAADEEGFLRVANAHRPSDWTVRTQRWLSRALYHTN